MSRKFRIYCDFCGDDIETSTRSHGAEMKSLGWQIWVEVTEGYDRDGELHHRCPRCQKGEQ